jgi:tyrosyl-tRNA synthetase
MAGRDLQRAAGQEPQVCLTMPILRGLDGVKKMGKSLGNYIGLAEPANEQFAKVMSIPDELMEEWFLLLTDRKPEEIRWLTNADANPESTMIHPMEAKKKLARSVVACYHSAEAADAARTAWERQFSRREDPEDKDIPEATVPAAELLDGQLSLARLLVLLQMAKSNNEARQKIQEGAVSLGPERMKFTDPRGVVAVSDGLVVRLGSRRIVRVRLT